MLSGMKTPVKMSDPPVGTHIVNEPPPELLNGDARELWRQATIIVETPQTNDRLTELALSIRRELRDESRIARLEQDNRILRGTIAMACDRLGGLVDGKPPHEGNFLQRIDELVGGNPA